MANIDLEAGEIQKIDRKYRGSASAPSLLEVRLANDAADDAVVYYAGRQEAIATIGSGTAAAPENDPADTWMYMLTSEVKSEDFLSGGDLYLYSSDDASVRFYVKNYVKP
jgi:hypothetical protein